MKTLISRRKALWIIGGTLSVSLVGYRFLSRPVMSMLGLVDPNQLTPDHWSNIGLLVDQILPKTATAPSGVDAGVLNYMTRALKGDLPSWKPSLASVTAGKFQPLSSGYKHLSGHYVKTAERLDALSSEMYGRLFSQLSFDERTKIVSRFSEGAKADVGYNVKGAPTVATATDKSLFELIRRHSIEGYFSDPANGGNKNYVAWESIHHTCHYNYPKDQTNCPKHEM